jgi:hypothetical protein
VKSPQLSLRDWLPALPPYLPLPRWLVRLMLEAAPVSPLMEKLVIR